MGVERGRMGDRVVQKICNLFLNMSVFSITVYIILIFYRNYVNNFDILRLA